MDRRLRITLIVLAMVAAGISAHAQTGVSSTDIERLQFAMGDARADLSPLRSRNAALADRLDAQLDEMGEEVIYLKVRVRREKNVPRNEYTELRDRIDDLRSQARAGTGSANRSAAPADTRTETAPPARRAGPNEVPVGQELDVRLQSGLNSGTAKVEDRFEATTLVEVLQDGKVLVPAGSVMRGVVSAVAPATRTDRKGSMTLAFDQLTVSGRGYPIRATVTQAIESEGIRGESGRIATGAGVGAIIGGLLGGFKGAMAGILIGGGGTVAATEGTDVNLPQGTVLRVRFDTALVLK